jgi:hypothetical protein
MEVLLIYHPQQMQVQEQVAEEQEAQAVTVIQEHHQD